MKTSAQHIDNDLINTPFYTAEIANTFLVNLLLSINKIVIIIVIKTIIIIIIIIHVSTSNLDLSEI